MKDNRYLNQIIENLENSSNLIDNIDSLTNESYIDYNTYNSIKSIRDECVSLRNESFDKMSKLYKHRNILYDNLITAYSSLFYLTKIEKYKDENKALENIKMAVDLTTPENSEIIDRLDSMERISSLYRINNFIESSLIPKLIDDGRFFGDIFNNIKVQLGYPGVKYNHNGIYDLPKLLGTVEKSNIAAIIELPNGLSDISDQKKDGGSIKLTAIATETIVCEDGSEDFPWIIASKEDFKNKYLSLGGDLSKHHFLLINDIDISWMLGSKVLMNIKTLGGVRKIKTGSLKINISGYLENILIERNGNSPKLTFKNGTTSIKNIWIKYGTAISNVPIDHDIEIENEVKFDDFDLHVGCSSISLCLVSFKFELTTPIRGEQSNSLAIERDGNFIKISLHKKEEGEDDPNLPPEEEEEEETYEPGFDGDDSKTFIASVAINGWPTITSGTNTPPNIINKNDVIINGETFMYNKDDDGDIEYFNNETYGNLFINNDGTVSFKIKASVEVDDNDPDTDNEMKSFNIITTLIKFTLSQYLNVNALYTSDDLKLLILLADLASYKLYDRKTESQSEIMKKLSDTVLFARERFNITLDNTKKSIVLNNNNISEASESFSKIENNKTTTDLMFDTTYTTKIKSNLESLPGYIEMLSSSVASNLPSVYSEFESFISEALLESRLVIAEVISAIYKIDQIINRHAQLYEKKESIDAEIISALDSIVDSMSDLGIRNTKGIEKFSKWLDLVHPYFTASVYTLSELYIYTEIGLKSLRKVLSESDPVLLATKYMVYTIFNSIVRDNLMENDLIKPRSISEDGLTDSITMSILRTDLADNYNIIVNESCCIEKLPYHISKLDKGFEFISRLDLKDFISSIKISVSNSSLGILSGTAIYSDIFYKPLLEYIFKDSIPPEIINRINNLVNLLENTQPTLKILIVSYYLNIVIKSLAKRASLHESNIMFEYKDDLSLIRIQKSDPAILAKYIVVNNTYEKILDESSDFISELPEDLKILKRILL